MALSFEQIFVVVNLHVSLGKSLVKVSRALKWVKHDFITGDSERFNGLTLESCQLFRNRLIAVHGEPFCAFTVLPEAIATSDIFFVIRDGYCLIFCEAVLPTIFPETFVHSTILPYIYSISMLRIIDILSFIGFRIRLLITAISMHVTSLPLTIIFTSILPLNAAISIDFIAFPLALVLSSICPKIGSRTLLHAFDIRTQVSWAIGPDLFSMAMHFALGPGAPIHNPIRMSVYTHTAHQVRRPAALVHIAIWIGKCTTTCRLVELPCTNVLRSISPYHGALAMAHPAQPSSTIDSTSCFIGIRSLFEPI